MPSLGVLSQRLNFNIGSISFAPSYLQALAIIALLFLLVLTLAQMRRHFMSWSIKGAIFGLFFGFLLTLILEGFLLISGRTALTQIIGWKNAPKPIAVCLDAGRSRLINVLGVADQVPATKANEKMSKDEVIVGFQSLSPQEASSVRKMICAP